MGYDLKSDEVLLVEDNPADARMIKDYFSEAFNIDIKHFVDGSEVLDYLYDGDNYENKELPSIIILDINLPKIDGLKVLKKIKNDFKLKKIPVIAFGTSSDPLEVKKVYDNHANCFIVKPIDFDELNEILGCIGKFWLNLTELP
ncbi:response regulator [Methanobacterium sp. ACI-7]|uniref:response regulator n=1 Tax=unclassified Methanobacterium TaxID=2627676 RepID=UPI0039C1471B